MKLDDIEERISKFTYRTEDFHSILSELNKALKLISQMRVQWLDSWAKEECLSILEGTQWCQRDLEKGHGKAPTQD